MPLLNRWLRRTGRASNPLGTFSITPTTGNLLQWIAPSVPAVSLPNLLAIGRHLELLSRKFSSLRLSMLAPRSQHRDIVLEEQDLFPAAAVKCLSIGCLHSILG